MPPSSALALALAASSSFPTTFFCFCRRCCCFCLCCCYCSCSRSSSTSTSLSSMPGSQFRRVPRGDESMVIFEADSSPPFALPNCKSWSWSWNCNWRSDCTWNLPRDCDRGPHPPMSLALASSPVSAPSQSSLLHSTTTTTTTTFTSSLCLAPTPGSTTTTPTGAPVIGIKSPTPTAQQKYSIRTRSPVASRWREYHGCSNWRGLLDPLDDNLRQEIVKYGELVQATYSAMEFDPTSPRYGCCRYPHRTLLDRVGMDGCGYRVTSSIFASCTSGGGSLAHMAMAMAAGRRWQRLLRRTSWMGFVAVCDDDAHVYRLGRRDIVVAYRGTVTPLEWLQNLNTSLITAAPPGGAGVGCRDQGQATARVQKGFWGLYTSKQHRRGLSLADQLVAEIRRLADRYSGEPLSVTITGHSLGAALALFSAVDLRRVLPPQVPVAVFTFGGPRVGNEAFARRVEAAANVLRVVNVQDVITKVPGILLNESASLPRPLLPWAYCHAGTELRLDSRHCPYLRPDADMSCCHDLEAYLHLVDGFLSSQCPFRQSAKRDILRLLINQKSNVLHDLSLTYHDPHTHSHPQPPSFCV